MKCTHMKVGAHNVIVCGPRRRPEKCEKCGKPATKVCDWRIDSYHTCDKPICDACTHSPAPGKDLCPRHAEIWANHPENPDNRNTPA